jgi:hypothetical protein
MDHGAEHELPPESGEESLGSFTVAKLGGSYIFPQTAAEPLGKWRPVLPGMELSANPDE